MEPLHQMATSLTTGIDWKKAKKNRPSLSIANSNTGKYDIQPIFYNETNLTVLYLERNSILLKSIGYPSGNHLNVAGTTVNAFYSPFDNAVQIPLGILQPPIYDCNYPTSLIRGSVGFLIGHEIGHAVDDVGSKFGTFGQYRNLTNGFYEVIGESIIDYLVSKTNDEYVNVTVNEDIADYIGFNTIIQPDSPSETLLQFAQLWCSTNKTFSGDVHAPDFWRVNSSVELNWEKFTKVIHCTTMSS